MSLLLLLLQSCEQTSSADKARADEQSSDSSSSGDADTDTDADTDSDSDADTDADADQETNDSGDPDTDTDTATADTADDECTEALATDVVLFMSADDSNSQASPVLARSTIASGDLFYGRARAYEFLNYYSFDYPPAETGTIGLVGAMTPSSVVEGGYELVVAAVAPDVDNESRAPMNLVFSVDCSGSMAGENLELVKASIRAMASELRAGDIVSVLPWNTSTSVVLDGFHITGPDDPDLLDAVDDLTAGGSTDLSLGLETAYELAQRHAHSLSDNRVVLLSDGGANTGVTDTELIGRYAAAYEQDAIYLIGVGTTAPASYATLLMDDVTDAGRGAHVYIDSSTEAEWQFTGERFLQNLQVSAIDVRLAMTLPAGWVVDRFSGEEISTVAAEVFPQNLGSNDQMLYHLTVHNCSGADDATFVFSADYQDRQGTPSTVGLTATVSELVAAADTNTTKAVAVIEAADAIDTVWKLDAAERTAAIEAAETKVRAVSDAQPTDADLAELTALLSAYSRMF